MDRLLPFYSSTHPQENGTINQNPAEAKMCISQNAERRFASPVLASEESRGKLVI